MSGLRSGLLVAALLTAGQTSALAWEPETRVRMIDEAVRLMPASLRQALQKHREPLLRGMLEPMTDEAGPAHRPPWRAAGTLDARLEQVAGELSEILGGPASFDGIAKRFGAVAHFVADAGFPPGASKGDGSTRYAHFSWFCEDRRERFPFVFYGHEDAQLDAADYRGFARRVMQSSSSNDLELARAYAAAGTPPDPSAFDDRSVPFAVGSLSYSRSITHIVRVWIDIWQRAGGDMASVPYWKPAGS